MLAWTAGAAAATDGTSAVSVGVSQNYSEGNYGTSTNTTIEYIPFFVKYQEDDLTLKVTVPYISVQSAGAAISGGTVVGPPGTLHGHSAYTVTNESGLGDVWLEGHYRIHGQGQMADVIPYAKVKVGTASRSNNLGTGEEDYEGGVGLEWTVEQNTFPFLDVGYRVLGQPPHVTLHNIVLWDAGAMVKVNDKDYVTGMFSDRQAAITGESDALDLLGALTHALSPTTRLQIYFDKGLSNGSPSYAVGVGVETRI